MALSWRVLPIEIKGHVDPILLRVNKFELSKFIDTPFVSQR